MKEFWLIPIFLAFAIAGGLYSCVAKAQQLQCEPASELAKLLSERFHERPVWGGLIPGQGSLVVNQSRSGSWTVILLTPDGRACALGHGERGRFIPNKVLEGS